MVGYLLLFLCLLLSYRLKDDRSKLICIFISITLFSGLRYGIGYDYYIYLDCCQKYSVGGERFEKIPYCLVLLAQQTTPYLFFVLTSVFISVFYYYGIKKAGKDYYSEALFYICFPLLFYNQMSVIRQGMATAVVFYILTYKGEAKFNKKTFIFQILLLLIAISCHRSALAAILLFLPWQNFSKMKLWVMLVFSFLVGEFVVPIFESILNFILLDDYDKAKALDYLNSDNINEGRLIKYIIYIIAIFSLIVYDDLTKIKNQNRYYIGILILGVCLLSLFSFNSTLSNRLCMFFFSISIILVPQIIKIVKLPKPLFIVLCVLLFSMQIYIGSSNVRFGMDEPGHSVSYPYETFLGKLL